MLLYHLDLKYSMYKPEYLINFFTSLKASGYGGVVVEIDDKLVFPSHPEFAAPDALESQDLNALVLSIKELGLSVYPLIQTLGHMEHILYPESPYNNLAEIPGERYMVCPSKKATAAFIKDLIKDVYEVFDRPDRIHLGGDESRRLGNCPLCVGKESYELMAPYLTNLAEYVLNLGMQPEFWADMLISHPDMLDNFPKEARIVDWNYSRNNRFSKNVEQLWGQTELNGLPVRQARAGLSDELKILEPYMFSRQGEFDSLYAFEALKSKGFEVMLASAARSSGDTYFLPQTGYHAANISFTDEIAGQTGCDHLVTSWAVRLSHPETTWYSLLSAQYTRDAQADWAAELSGNISTEMLDDANLASWGKFGVDVLDERVSRFETPCYGKLVEGIRSIDANDRQKLEQRLLAADRLLAALEKNVCENAEKSQALEHWILGLKMSLQKAAQTIDILDTFAGEKPVSALISHIDENNALMGQFADLWQKSLTPESLEREMDVKFKRDIRTLEALTTQ